MALPIQHTHTHYTIFTQGKIDEIEDDAKTFVVYIIRKFP